MNSDTFFYKVESTQEQIEIEIKVGDSYEMSIGKLFSIVIEKFEGKVPNGEVWATAKPC